MREPARSWHIVTGEYPPQIGGVGDHTQSLAIELARSGADVHVWCPVGARSNGEDPGVTLHPTLGTLSWRDLRITGQMLDRFPSPRRVLVQWVPHGYRFRSLNVGICLWFLWRARRGDLIDLMIHEPFLPFGRGKWRQNSAAVIHRVMLALLLRAASRVWLSTMAWEQLLVLYARLYRGPIDFLPVGTAIPQPANPDALLAVRRTYAGPGRRLVGSFGSHRPDVVEPLEGIIGQLVREDEAVDVLLLGKGGPESALAWQARHPLLRGRIHAPGVLSAADVGAHIGACDVMIQPYPDGITTRRSSTMAALALGKPVVTTIGPLTEPRWQESGSVVLVPVGHPGAAVHEVRRLLADDSYARELSERANRDFVVNLSLKNAVARLHATP